MTSAPDELPASERREADPLIGRAIAKTYRITRHIGSGSSGHVYQAEHVRLGKAFAIKFLRPELGGARRIAQRFRREARAMAQVSSEYVVSVVDCGETDDHTPYLVLELLEGEDLRSLLGREGSLPARRAVHLVLDACAGLSAVHRAGFIHRDLKPENLFVTRRASGEDWCKVLDFGVAKMEASLSTAEGAIVGTVRYMAPEQLADNSAVGPATDVYALGAILYECLSGRPLHEGETVQELMYRVMNQAPAPLLDLHPGIPRSLASLIERCTAKVPGERPPSAAELSRLLAETCGSPQLDTRSVTLQEHVIPRSPSSARTIAWLGPAAVAGLAGLALGWTLNRSNAPEREVATVIQAARGVTLSLSAQIPTTAASVIPAAPVERATHVGELSSAPTTTAAAAIRPSRQARGPRPTKQHAAAPLSPSAQPAARLPVGHLDVANPYGE